MAKNPTPTGPIRSGRELATLAGKSHTAVQTWTRHPEWSFGRAPWPRTKLPEILRWVADTLKPQAGPEDPLGDPDGLKALRKDKLRKEIRKLEAQADTAETALARERGLLYDAAEVESEWASVGATIRNGLQNLSSQLVALALSHGLPPEAAATFAQQADEAINGVLRHLSRDGRDGPETDN